MSLRIHRLVRTLAAVAFAGVALPALAQTEIQWWHSMTGALNDRVNEFAKGFNESQKEYKVTPTFKGSYPETLTAGIAAFRQGREVFALLGSQLDLGVAAVHQAGAQ